MAEFILELCNDLILLTGVCGVCRFKAFYLLRFSFEKKNRSAEGEVKRVFTPNVLIDNDIGARRKVLNKACDCGSMVEMNFSRGLLFLCSEIINVSFQSYDTTNP
jgi:hypothetical protein